ncbi:hypothetical protein B0H14DRAFT_2569157 [Mycena olivaceomarginata]|nr:hypothetical protein B0H14DRAFT_2569157 [Mycena olivaceomarginata]
MSKDNRMTAAQWVDCEKYHDSMMKFVDRSSGRPGNEPFGYDIYCTHVPKAPVLENFPATVRQWEAFQANQAKASGTTGNVHMTSDAFGMLANVPNIIAQTMGNLMVAGQQQHMIMARPLPSPRPRFPHFLGFPRHGIATGGLPFMSRPNRAHGGLIGEPELNIFEAACLPENQGRIGGSIHAKGWKRRGSVGRARGAVKKDFKKDKKGRHGGKKGKARGAAVAAISVLVESSEMEVEIKTEEVKDQLPAEVPASVETEDASMDDDYDELFDEEPVAAGWNGTAAEPRP